MRRSVFVLLVCCFLCAGSLLAQGLAPRTVEFERNWGDPGFSIVSQSASGLEIVFSVPKIDFDQKTVGNEVLTTVAMPGVILPNNAGAPDLPGQGRFIAIPCGAGYRVEVLSSRTEVFEGIDLLPAAPIQAENDDSPPVFVKDQAIYSLDAVYPAQPVMASELIQLRGADTFVCGVTPFAYNPVRKTLTVYTDIRIKVTFEGGSGSFGYDAYRNRYFEPLLAQHLLNYASLPPVEFGSQGATRGDECEYMIFCPDDADFLAWADTIKDFRVKQGVSTNVFNIADLGGNAAGIENKIDDAYNNWTTKPIAALMLGDLPYVPVFSVSGYSSMLSDNKYADVNGDDLPEINVARITARNAADLDLMVNKFIDYETAPPTNPSFYDEPIIAGGWQSDRWFIICADVIWGFQAYGLGKNPVREYAGYGSGAPTYWSTNTNTPMIIDYFGQSGLGYIPDVPSHLTDWGANATRINADINSGAYYLLHRDHGYESGWGDPSYSTGNLSGLNNDDLTFVMSINCLTGKYDYSPECFAEAFHRMQYGAVGLIAASHISFSFVNDTFVWGMHDSLWPQFDPGYGGSTGDNQLMPGFAHASGKWYLQASSWPYNPSNKFDTYHLFHMHGDAFFQLYSEVPQNLTVSHGASIDNTATSFDVTADAGSLIALSAHGEVLGTAEGTGSSVTVTIDPPMFPGIMYVTVTDANHYRYEGQVVIQTGGPLAMWPSEGLPDSVLPGPETEVAVSIVDGVEQYVPGSGLIHYRFSPSETFSTTSLNHVSGYVYSGMIPGARPDSQPEFYFSAEGDQGSVVYSPSDAPNTTYSYGLDPLPWLMMLDNCEDDLGWTVVDENITTGTWERCVPNTTSGEQVAPTTDNPSGTGTFCFVTENGPPGGSYSDYDIDGGPTRLISPTIDLSTGDATIGAYLWYYSRDNNDAFTVDVSNNDGTTWTNVLSTMSSLSGWAKCSFNVADYVTPTSTVKVRISAKDQPNNDIVEAGLDDFSVARMVYDASIWLGAYGFPGDTGCDLPVYMDAGAANAGRPYLLCASLAGSYPGRDLPGGGHAPLNWDWLSQYILDHLYSPLFVNFYGNLDSEGEAMARLYLPGPYAQAYIGDQITFVFCLYDNYDFVSNPVAVDIE